MKAKYHISKKDYVASGRLYARPTVKVVIVSVMVFAVLLVVAVYAPPAVSAPIVGGLIGWIVFFPGGPIFRLAVFAKTALR
ncbi:MAG: hypothetical protein CL543_12575 [Alcanivorax sp.]|nr:hypothetical protein [Alcanivorax sp.]